MRYTFAAGDKPVPGYTIRQGLGRGGFGEVYLAVSDGGKEVALKLLQRNFDVELRGVGQCLNIKHPNLVSLFDILRSEKDDHWIVMEYVAGDNLEQVLARYPQGLEHQEAIAWLLGICDGVGCLHDHGIVHRDLKPGNIFVEHGIVKVGDYGLAKFISASQRCGQTESVGTVHYMAPEVSMGRYGKEVDQYALGVILYRMLTGRLPFDGETPGEILMKHLTAEPDLAPLPEPYRSVVARLLVKDPQARYSSIKEIGAGLPGIGHARASEILRAAQPSDVPCQPSETQSYPGAAADQPMIGLASQADTPTPSSPPQTPRRWFDLLTSWFGAAQAKRSVPGEAEQPENSTMDKFQLVQVLMDNGMSAEDIAQVMGALADHPEHWQSMVRATQTLVENGTSAEDVAGVLRAVGRFPVSCSDSPGEAIQAMLEHGVDPGDMVKVLHALAEYSDSDQQLLMRAIMTMLEYSADTDDITALVRALSDYRETDLGAMVMLVETMLASGFEIEDIQKVLQALELCPQDQLPAKATTIRSMVEEGADAREIEQRVRA